MKMLISLKIYLNSLRDCNVIKISTNSVKHIDAFPNYFVSNGVFPEHDIHWKFDDTNNICLVLQNNQRFPKWIFPQPYRIKLERAQSKIGIKSMDEKKKSLSKLLSINCESNFKGNYWIITFKDDIDAQIRGFILFIMTYDPLKKTCSRFQAMQLLSNKHSLLSLHSEVEAENIDRSYLKVVSKSCFNTTYHHPQYLSNHSNDTKYALSTYYAVKIQKCLNY